MAYFIISHNRLCSLLKQMHNFQFAFGPYREKYKKHNSSRETQIIQYTYTDMYGEKSGPYPNE